MQSRTARYDQAALLRPVDDVHLEPGPHQDPIEERVRIRGLAHGARGDGPIARRAVLVHQALEAFERVERGLHRAGADPPRRERVLAERHAAHDLFDHERPAALGKLRDDKAHGAGANVDDRHGLRAFRRRGRGDGIFIHDHILPPRARGAY